MSTERPPSWLDRGLNLAGLFDRRDDVVHTWPDGDRELALIRAAGFTHVRLPVRWWGHAEQHPPFQLEPSFAEQVDEAVAAAHSQGLGVVLSMHHADGMMVGEPGALNRLCALWQQIAGHYRSVSGDLAYDLLNEPRDALTVPTWNRLLPAVLGAVRALDPTRTVIVAGAGMSTLDGLLALRPPPDDHLAVTMHYYEPFTFTHQSVPWEPASATWADTRWGSPSDQRRVTDDLERAHDWAADHGMPLYVGEFGTYQGVDQSDRVAWTAWVRAELTRLSVPWAYWDFRTDFGVYDANCGRWRDPLLDVLTDRAHRHGTTRQRAPDATTETSDSPADHRDVLEDH